MAKTSKANNNYGLAFCKKGLALLARKEKAMFDKYGHGFAADSKDASEEMRYKRLQLQFEKERSQGVPPTYDPQKHGMLDDIDLETATFAV